LAEVNNDGTLQRKDFVTNYVYTSSSPSIALRHKSEQNPYDTLPGFFQTCKRV